jgi:hypothetical protein
MYEETPEADRGLKEISVKFAVKHVDILITWAPFRDVCKAVGEIGLDMWAVPRKGELKEICCPNCRNSDSAYYGGASKSYHRCNNRDKYFPK